MYEDHDLIFCKSWGVPLDGSYVSRLVHRITVSAGLPRIRFHDLRHTSATILLKRGVPLKVTAEILGHSTTALTANTYSYVLPEMQREAAQKMGQHCSVPSPSRRLVNEAGGPRSNSSWPPGLSEIP